MLQSVPWLGSDRHSLEWNYYPHKIFFPVFIIVYSPILPHIYGVRHITANNKYFPKTEMVSHLQGQISRCTDRIQYFGSVS